MSNSNEVREAIQRIMVRMHELSPEEFQFKLTKYRDSDISYAFTGCLDAAELATTAEIAEPKGKCLLPEWHDGPCTINPNDPRIILCKHEVE